MVYTGGTSMLKRHGRSEERLARIFHFIRLICNPQYCEARTGEHIISSLATGYEYYNIVRIGETKTQRNTVELM